MANNLACSWCGAPGDDAGPQYGPLRLARCTKCHHEWQYSVPHMIQFFRSKSSDRVVVGTERLAERCEQCSAYKLWQSQHPGVRLPQPDRGEE